MRDGVLFVAQAALLLLCAHGSSELFDSATEHEIHPLVSDLEDVVPLSAPKLGKDGTVAVAKEDAKETTKAKVTILGEAIKSGYPGPFAPPLPPSGGFKSENTEGYNRKFNRYGGTEMACGGDSNGGTMQSYVEALPPAEGGQEYPTDIGHCVDMCNACDGCVGFIDEINVLKCNFMSALTYKECAVTDPLDLMRRYYNKVKTYGKCPPGKASMAEDEECHDCQIGKYGSGGVPCADCQTGRYTDADGKSTCTLCVPGTFANAAKSACEDCMPGVFSEGEVDHCSGCPPGYYGDSQDLSTCKECAAGQYSLTEATFCLPCDAGMYSEIASSSCIGCSAGRKSAADNAQCESCPGGQFAGPTMGQCPQCPEGKWSSSNSAQCTVCQAGRFQANPGSDSCADCPFGKYAASAAATTCNVCAAGKFSLEGSQLCTDCEAGQTSADISSHCTDCIIGKFSSAAGSDSCTTCDAGKIADAPKSDECTDCEIGMFIELQGQGACKQCDHGKMSQVTGMTVCTDCVAGYYNDVSGTNSCQGCAAGHFTHDEAISVCSSCGAGFFAPALATTCTQCASGTISATIAESCGMCPGGKKSDTLRSTCETCSAGHFSLDGAASCEECISGTIAANVGLTTCASCTAGKKASSVASVVCEDCGAGWYSEEGSDECIRCVSGRASAVNSGTCDQCIPGKVALEGSETCSECAVGKDQQLAGEQVCSECVAGRYAGVVGASRCSECAIGYMSSGGKTVCDACVPGKIAPGGEGSVVCSLCPGATYSGMTLHEISLGECSTDWSTRTHIREESGVANGHDIGPTLGSWGCNKLSELQASYGIFTWKDPDNNKVYVVEEKSGSGTCTTCPNGAVAQPGSAECEVCAAGKAASADGMSCEACPKGKGSEKGATVCDNCLPGFFAPEDPLKPNTGEGTGECSPCEAGKYAPSEGWDQECLTCVKGHYSQLSEGSALCVFCSLGQYSAVDMAAECENCPIGQYINVFSQTACLLCPMGKHMDNTGGHNCKQCPTGKFKDQVGSYVCSDCSPGKFAPATGQALCTDCSVGFFQTGYGQGSCTACAARTSSTTAHSGDCFTCASGEVTSAQARSCNPCPAGKYQDGNACTTCEPGKHQGAMGMTQCDNCLAGTISPTKLGYFTGCELCDVGFIQPDTGKSICTACVAGKLSSLNGEVCQDCPAGKYDFETQAALMASGGGLYCKECIRGQYSTTGVTSCVNCQIGKFAQNKGTSNECALCLPGKYSDSATQTVCKDCETGKVATATGLTTCTDCVAGQFQEPQNTLCSLCPQGEVQPESGKAECIKCLSGKAAQATTYKTACDECQPGTFSDGMGLPACKTCPPGTYSAMASTVAIAGMMDCYDLTQMPSAWQIKGVASSLDIAKALCNGFEYMTLSCPSKDRANSDGILQAEVRCGNNVFMPSGKLPFAECAGVNDVLPGAAATHLGLNSANNCSGPFFWDYPKAAILGGHQRGAVYPLADIVYGERRGSTDCPMGYQQITNMQACRDAAIAMGNQWQHDTVAPYIHPQAIPNCFMGPSMLVEGNEYQYMANKNLKVYWNIGGVTSVVESQGQGWPICKRPDPALFDNTEHVATWEPTGGGTPITMATAQVGDLDWVASGNIAPMPLVTYTTADHIVSTNIPMATINSVATEKATTTTANEYVLRTDFNHAAVNQYDGSTNTGGLVSSAFKLGVGTMTFDASGGGGSVNVCKADAQDECIATIRPNVAQTQDQPWECQSVQAWADYPQTNQNQESHVVPSGGFGSCNNQGWSKKGDAYKEGTSAGCYNGDFWGSALGSANGGQAYTCQSAGAWQTYTALPASGSNTASGQGWSRRGPPQGKAYQSGTSKDCDASAFWGTYAMECPASHPNAFKGNKACCHTTVMQTKTWAPYSINGGRGYCGPNAMRLPHTATFTTGLACKQICEGIANCKYASYSTCDVTRTGFATKEAAKAVVCQPCASQWTAAELVVLGAGIKAIVGLPTDDAVYLAGQGLEECDSLNGGGMAACTPRLNAVKTALGGCAADAANNAICWLMATCPQWHYVDNTQVQTYEIIGAEEECPAEQATNVKFREVGGGTCMTEDSRTVYTATREGFLGGKTACEATCQNWDKCTGYSWGENGLGAIPKWPWPKCYLHIADHEGKSALPPAPPNPLEATQTGAMEGVIIRSITYAGGTESEQDLDCSNKCQDEAECTFWQRATGNADGNVAVDCTQTSAGDGNMCDYRPDTTMSHVIGGTPTDQASSAACVDSCKTSQTCVSGFFTFEEVVKNMPRSQHSSSSVAKTCDVAYTDITSRTDATAVKTGCASSSQQQVIRGDGTGVESCVSESSFSTAVHSCCRDDGLGAAGYSTKVMMNLYGGCRNNQKVTFEQAQNICAGSTDTDGVKLRLCTLEEVKGGRTTGTGCNFDSQMVWTTPEYNAAAQPIAQTAACQSCADYMEVGELVAMGSAIKSAYPFPAHTGTWVQTANQKCGQGGGCSMQESMLNIGTPTIATTANAHMSADGTTVDLCKATCNGNTDCQGFAYDKANSRCLFRRSTSCNSPADSNFDCYTKGGNREIAGFANDLAACSSANTVWKYSGSGQSCDQQCSNEGMTCDQTAMNQNLDVQGFRDILSSITGTPIAGTNAVVEDCYVGQDTVGLSQYTPWYKPADQLPKWCNSDFLKTPNQKCGSSATSPDTATPGTTCPPGPAIGSPSGTNPSSWSADSTSVEDCQKVCRASPLCVAFNYDKTNNRCYYRSNDGCDTSVDSTKDCYRKAPVPDLNSCSRSGQNGFNRICACKGGQATCKARKDALVAKLGGCTGQTYAEDAQCAGGDLAGPWCPADTEMTTGWHQIDMGQQITITGVRVHKGSDIKYATSWVVKTSTDGSTWTERSSCTGLNSWTGQVDCKFVGTRARYVRVYPTAYIKFPVLKMEVWVSDDGYVEEPASSGSSNACTAEATQAAGTLTTNTGTQLSPEQCIAFCAGKSATPKVSVGDDGSCMCCAAFTDTRIVTKGWTRGPDGKCYLLNRKASSGRSWTSGVVGFSKTDASVCWLKKNFQSFNDPGLANLHHNHNLRGGFRFQNWQLSSATCLGDHFSCVIRRAQPLSDFKCYAKYSWQWCDTTKDPLSVPSVTCGNHATVTNAVCEYAECPAGSSATAMATCPKSDTDQWVALRTVSNPQSLGYAPNKESCQTKCKNRISSAANTGTGKACAWSCSGCFLGDAVTTVDAASHAACYQYTIADATRVSTCNFPGQQDSTTYPSECPCVADVVNACQYACCPAGFFTSSGSTCQGSGCNFPSVVDAHKFPAGCPCAKRKWFYRMQTFTIALDNLANWAGYDVVIKIVDDNSIGFMAIDNLSYKGAPYSCVAFDGDWISYTETELQMPAGGLGTGEGWSKSLKLIGGAQDPNLMIYIPGTKMSCEGINFWNQGTTGNCAYRKCPVGAITARFGICRGSREVTGPCHWHKFPKDGHNSAVTQTQHPADCPCMKLN